MKCSSFIPFLLSAALAFSGCKKAGSETGPSPSVPPPPKGELTKPNATDNRERTATAYDRNLIVNGGAELKEEESGAPIGWTKAEGVKAEDYGHTSGEWEYHHPGIAGGKERYFRFDLKTGEERKAISQKLTLAGDDAEIDAGKVECALGGAFGGFRDGHHSTLAEVDFIDAAGKTLAGLKTEPPKPNELPKPEFGDAGLIERTASGEVPAGTRQIEVRLVGINLKFAEDSSEGPAMADNLTLVLKKKP